jgi:hypothetical protein
MLQSIERVEKRQDRTFFSDLFMAITQMEGVQPRNIPEIGERRAEAIQQLGPVIAANEQETAVGIQRVLNIMMRRGMVKPMPASLRRVPVGVKYTSIMKLLQRAAQTASMERVVGVIGNLQQGSQSAGVRGPWRLLKVEDFTRLYADHLDFPAKLLQSKRVEERQRLRFFDDLSLYEKHRRSFKAWFEYNSKPDIMAVTREVARKQDR